MSIFVFIVMWSFLVIFILCRSVMYLLTRIHINNMIRLKHLITEVKYDYGCVMAQMPPSVSSQFIAFGKKIIPDDILYFNSNEPDDYGREKEMHITIKFGLTQSYSKEQMGQMLKGTKPFYISILGMDIFQNPEFDVVKFNISGDALHQLRKVFDALPNADEHKVFHPHMTIAYVKAGMGEQYKKMTKSNSQIPVNLIKYSDRGNNSFYRL